LISCGFDFEIFVWNPYVERIMMKLEGHESPLVGVSCPQNIPYFVSCDTNGLVKVWSENLICVQTFYVPNVNTVTCLNTIPKHRRLICGSRVFKVFEYPKPFTPELSDDNPIICANYSPIRMEFYIAGERNIKIWNARIGKPVRELRQCMPSDITCLEFDHEHRELIVGDHNGTVRIFDILSGV
jgi:WD40 repeat protein